MWKNSLSVWIRKIMFEAGDRVDRRYSVIPLRGEAWPASWLAAASFRKYQRSIRAAASHDATLAALANFLGPLS
jgi:hypothetical protein